MERLREDKQWERRYFEHPHPEAVHDQESAPEEKKQPEWEDFMDAEDYLNHEEKFNVTDRLVLLFPKFDVEPSDGFVTEHELTEWNVQLAAKEVMHKTQRDMKVHDKNKDGYVSFTEYEPPSGVVNTDQNSFAYNMGVWKEEHFSASDTDGDGLLNIFEFNDFLHLADTKNPKLLRWLCKEEVRERDSDKDGKLNFNKFFQGLFDLVRDYDEETHNSSHAHEGVMEAPARKLFSQLEKNSDGYLTDEDLLPIVGKLHPSGHYYAKQQANYSISQANKDKDGRLTLTEMIDNPYVFYSAVFNDGEDDYNFHDEFRCFYIRNLHLPYTEFLATVATFGADLDLNIPSRVDELASTDGLGQHLRQRIDLDCLVAVLSPTGVIFFFSLFPVLDVSILKYIPHHKFKCLDQLFIKNH